MKVDWVGEVSKRRIRLQQKTTLTPPTERAASGVPAALEFEDFAAQLRCQQPWNPKIHYGHDFGLN